MHSLRKTLFGLGASLVCVQVYFSGIIAPELTAKHKSFLFGRRNDAINNELTELIRQLELKNASLLAPAGYPILSKFVAYRLKEHEKDFVASSLANKVLSPIWGNAIYAVGNGDMTEEQHEILRNVSAKNIFRFNFMNNLNPDEPVGNLFARFATGPGWYNNLGCCIHPGKSCGRVAEALQIILTGGGNVSVQEEYLKGCAKSMPKVNVLVLPNSFLTYRGLIFANRAGSGFTSGFTSIAFLQASFPDAVIHTMGMNWGAGNPQRGHDMQSEEDFLRSDPRIVIHETLTSSYRPNKTKATVVGPNQTKAK